MARKKGRQTFEKMKREQAVKERRERKQERRAARLAKSSDADGAERTGEQGGEVEPGSQTEAGARVEH